jgi:hypothetical protein
MKKLMLLALVGTMAFATVSPVYAQDKGKCTKECAKKCAKAGKTCNKGDMSCCKGHSKV